MPIYEYRCTSCANVDEVFLRSSEPEPTACSQCGGGLERMISAASLSFKGSGWYVTDYAKSNGSSPSGNADASGNGNGKGKGNSGEDSPVSASTTPAESTSVSAGDSSANHKSATPSHASKTPSSPSSPVPAVKSSSAAASSPT